jgi:hypothetical protein
MTPEQLSKIAQAVAESTENTEAALLACWSRLFRVHLEAVEATHGVSMEALHTITQSSAEAYAIEYGIPLADLQAAQEALQRAETLLGHRSTSLH